MAGETQITLVGNVVDDAELRFTPSGAAVCNFRVASTPRSFDKQTNEWKDGEPLFLTCNVWRQAAENCAESLQKGMRVIVQGRLKSRSYEKDGQKRTVFEVEVDEVGPSLLRATAKVVKAQSGNGQQQGGGNWNGNQQSGNSGNWSGGQQQRQQPQQGSGGWGAPAGQQSYGSEPPF